MISKEAHPFRWHYGDLEDKNFQLHGHSLLILLLLLAILLLFVLLCIYFRRTCRYRTVSSPDAAAPNGGGMEATALRRLPVRVRQGEAAACSICLSTVVEGEKERVLPGCGHVFHPECVDEWLRKQSSCPLCRANVGGQVEKVAAPPPPLVVAVVP